jgi:hypothetical protein
MGLERCSILPCTEPAGACGFSVSYGSDARGRDAIEPAMSSSEPAAATTFTSGERDYIRRELERFFSTPPSVADGFQLRTWGATRRRASPRCCLLPEGCSSAG